MLTGSVVWAERPHFPKENGGKSVEARRFFIRAGRQAVSAECLGEISGTLSRHVCDAWEL